MKKIFKWIIPILLVALLVGSFGWYIFVYDRSTVQDFLTAQARNCAAAGNFDAATWFYNQSYKLSDADQNVAIELADIYKSVGNYTKAEYTLAKAVADGGDVDLYIALCKTYVEQDKLLDAVTMLDNISDPAIKAELDQIRPTVPSADYEPGFYNEYICLTFPQTSGTLYVTTDGDYPSTAETAYSEPVTLEGGETILRALVVAENGLVSPLSTLSYTVGGVDEQVTLTDPAIDAKAREILMFGQDTPLFTSDLWTITELELTEDITSLEDLQYFTYLKKLTVSPRPLDSLDFLANLTQLEELYLSGCTVTDDLSKIGALPALKKLDLSKSSLSTIAGLENAAGLVSLNLSSNAIGDISPLANMPLMQTLDLSHNAVTDLSALSSMPQLTELNVSYNSIGSIGSVGVCTEMRKLDITENNITSISALAPLTNLTHFYAGYNNIADVSVLAGCLKLQDLNLSNNALTDISALSVLTNVAYFDFSYNSVTAMPDLPKDCALITVNGEHNQLSDISVLGGMTHLNNVYMDYNTEISDVSFLEECTEIVLVNVYGTSVQDVSMLTAHSIIVNWDPTA